MQKNKPSAGLRAHHSPLDAPGIEQTGAYMFDGHVLFNAITAIQNLILQNERSGALKALQKRSLYLRHLNSAPQGEISLDQLEAYLQGYFALQNIRTRSQCELRFPKESLPLDSTVQRATIETELNHFFERRNLRPVEIIVPISTDAITLNCTEEEGDRTTNCSVTLPIIKPMISKTGLGSGDMKVR